MFTSSKTRMSQLTGTVTVVVLALSLSSLVLARPRHENNGHHHKNAFDVVFIGGGQAYPSDTGTTIRTDGLKKQVDNDPPDFNHRVRIDPVSPYPSGTGTTIRTDGQKKNKKNADNVVLIGPGQSYSSGTGTTIRTDAMRSSTFGRSMDLSGAHKVEINGRTSSSRASVAPLAPLSPSRAPRAGRGWMDVSADGENGLSANAGWSWNLR